MRTAYACKNTITGLLRFACAWQVLPELVVCMLQNKSLRELSLRGCDLSTIELTRILVCAAHVTHLDLSSVPGVCTWRVACVMLCARLLLRVVNCVRVGQVTVCGLLICAGPQVSDELLGVLATRVPNLVRLQLCACTRLGTHGIEMLVSSLPKCKQLQLEHNQFADTPVQLQLHGRVCKLIVLQL